MKSVKLLNLKLTNFKGIKEFELDADGQDIDIFANNGLGKTTIADSYSWLLSGKDSLNNATNKMGIKTKDENEKVIHRLEHTVEGVFLVEGQKVVLKKVFREVWRKKTGELTENHTGHTTDYYIDDAPVKEKDYNEYIDSIVDSETLPLLIDLWHFNDVYDHKKRRKLLFDIIGEITDEEIMQSNDELNELPNIIGSRSVEKHMEKILFEQKSLNNRIEEIPALIRENQHNLPPLPKEDEDSITNQINELSLDIDAKNDQITAIKNGSETNVIKKKISDIELEISNVQNKHTQNEQQEVFKLQAKLQEEQSNLSILHGEVKSKMQQKKMNDDRISEYESQLAALREDYKMSQEQHKMQSEQEFQHNDNCVCPTCEQDLPQGKIDEAVANFNRNKADLLEKIQKRIDDLNKKGPELGKKVEEIKSENEAIQSEIDKITKQGTDKKKDVEKLEEKIKTAQSTVTPVGENEKYKELINEKHSLEQQIEQLEESVYGSVNALRKEIDVIKEKQRDLQLEQSKFTRVKEIKERNSELEDEQKDKAKEYEELERQKHLLNKFTKTKVSMVEGSINKHFKYVNFKLFEELVNGGLRDICVVTYNGKVYGPELNEASRYNASLDVVNTLSKHFGVQLPLFIDKSESVTEFIDTDVQLITLNVSKQDKELRIEKRSEKESEVA